MHKIYYIGGSPCSGKSTVAQALAEKYDLHYFKVDDYLDKYTDKGASAGLPVCIKQEEMSPQEIWMRDPVLQCDEEFKYYEEIFDFIMHDISDIRSDSDIITEGAAFCPYLMMNKGISPKNYLSITPSADFQISHYKQREWVRFVLEGCSDKEKAFDNWMKRDILFARRAEKECSDHGYVSVINNGQLTVEELIMKTAEHFGL